MEFKCFTKWNQLPPSSDLLFSQAEKDSLFFSRRWFENLSSTAIENNQSLLLACVVEDDVLAILPLIQQDNGEWTSLSHIYTSLYTLLLKKPLAPSKQVLSCLAQGLSQLPLDSLTLGPVAADDDIINKLQDAMELSGLSCTRYAQFFNWYQPLNGQRFSDYMAQRPSKVRNTIKRKERKLKREQGYEIRLYTGSDIPQVMTDYYTVYNASWKKSERFEKLIEGLMYHFSKMAWVRLAILYINDKPVATQIWFVVHKKASIFKLAYDEQWKQYSPGSILTQYLMKIAIDTDEVKEIDFLTGNDRYKQDWMQERRQRWRLVFTRKAEPQKRDYWFIDCLRKYSKSMQKRLIRKIIE